MGGFAQSFSIPGPPTGDNNPTAEPSAKSPAPCGKIVAATECCGYAEVEPPAHILIYVPDDPCDGPLLASFPVRLRVATTAPGPVAEFPETPVRKPAPLLARVALIVACVGMLANSADAGLPAAKRPIAPPRVVEKSLAPRAWITVGKETTYVTGPVLEDGYVDYLAALNALASAGVTTENNAAVLLAQAIDPASIDAGQRERFYKILGVEPPKKSDGLFSDSAAFLTNQGDKFAETIDTLVPWSPEKFPPRAKWLTIHERALDLAVEATRRSRCYFAMIRKPGAEMIMAVLYGVQPSMEIGRALVARAAAAQRRTHRGCHAKPARLPPARAVDRQRAAAVAWRCVPIHRDQGVLRGCGPLARWPAVGR